MSVERILVTGGSGFVGNELVRQLREAGNAVSAPLRPAFDLLRLPTLAEACQGVDTIYHLAAYAHVNQADEKTVYDVNLLGTCNLLQTAMGAGVKRFIYVSSILADPEYDTPRTIYGQSKYDAEQALKVKHEQGRMAVSVIRPCSVYGVGMKGNLATLLRLIANGRLPPLPDFQQPFSLISVQELCLVLRLANERLQHSVPPQMPVYTVSDGERYTLKALEAAVRLAAGKKPYRLAPPRSSFYLGALLLELAGKLVRLKNAPGLRTYRALAHPYCVDDAESRRQLGYNPAITLYQKIPELLNRQSIKD